MKHIVDNLNKMPLKIKTLDLAGRVPGPDSIELLRVELYYHGGYGPLSGARVRYARNGVEQVEGFPIDLHKGAFVATVPIQEAGLEEKLQKIGPEIARIVYEDLTDASIFYPETDGEPMAVSDLHRRILTRLLQVLDAHFAQKPEVYVSGDILMYYVEGDPRKSVAPDVLVSFGLGKKLRRTYLVWEEGKVPDFVMEFSSKNTYRNDLEDKMELYALLGIQDYFLYDAEGLYLPTPLMGFTLVDGAYVPISMGVAGGLHSSALNLDFHVDDTGLGIYDPVAGEWLRTPAETAEARAETAEAEIERLRAELARFQAQDN